MRILVTGAGGFLAEHLIPPLRQRGHEVRGLVLGGDGVASLLDRGVAVFQGDVRDPDSLTAPMHGADAVFHLAAAIGVHRPIREYEAVNVGGTQNVCRAAFASGVKRLVHVSTTSVYAQGLGRAVAEDDRLAPLPDPYAITKTAGDLLVQRLIRDERLPATIVRTSTVYGPGDHLNFGRIAARVAAGKAIVIGSGSNAVGFTHVSDVVDGLLLALESDRAVGQVYNIVDDNPPTQRQLLDEVAARLGAPRPRVHVPYRLLYGAAFAAERVAAMTGASHAAVTRFGVALYGADNRYSIDRARRDLGYRPRVGFREGIRQAANWYLGQDKAAGAPAPAGAVARS